MWREDQGRSARAGEAGRREGGGEWQDMAHLLEMRLPRKKEETPSRLIVEFAVSNHNVLKQQRDKHSAKKVTELSVTQERGTKREFLDLSTKEKKRFGVKRSGRPRGDYDKQRKKPNTSNKHLAKRMRTRI